jgi:hypothetical protein
MGPNSAAGDGVSTSSSAAYAPALAMNSQGDSILTYIDDTGADFEIFVRRWVE